MPRIILPWLPLCGLLACGDPPLEPATFAEHCGVAGPLRILELPPDQALASTQQIGDRLYHTVGTLPPDENSSPHTPFTDRSTWSTGLCGESPILLADDLISIFTVERWPDVLLACQEGTGIVSLDPTGASPPHLLFPSPQCKITYADALAWTDHGVVALEDPAAPVSALRLFPFPDDPRTQVSEPVTLLDAVDTTVLVRAWPDAVHAVTSDGDLTRVDLPDLSVHVEQPSVRGFEFSADRRYLLWMDAAPVVKDDGSTVGFVSLRDHLTGTATVLGESLNPPSPFSLRWADQGLLAFDWGQRVYFLPDLAFVDVPNGFSIDFQSGPLDDDRWLLRGLTFITNVPGFALLDLQNGAVTTLYARPSRLQGRQDDAYLILDGHGCCVEGTYRTEGPLWYVPLDGGDARKLADRATTFRHQPDPLRIVTAIDLATDRRGTLIVADLETQAEHRIDDHVLFGPASLAPTDDPTLLLWLVHDGDRSGVWTAKLPPAP